VFFVAYGAVRVAEPTTRQFAPEDVQRLREHRLRRRERLEALIRREVHTVGPVSGPATHNLSPTPRAAAVRPRVADVVGVHVYGVRGHNYKIIANRRERRQRRDGQFLLALIDLRNRMDIKPNAHASQGHARVLGHVRDGLLHRRDVDPLRVGVFVAEPLVRQEDERAPGVDFLEDLGPRVVDDERVSNFFVELEAIQRRELVAR